jgi:hypothetical protein
MLPPAVRALDSEYDIPAATGTFSRITCEAAIWTENMRSAFAHVGEAPSSYRFRVTDSPLLEELTSSTTEPVVLTSMFVQAVADAEVRTVFKGLDPVDVTLIAVPPVIPWMVTTPAFGVPAVPVPLTETLPDTGSGKPPAVPCTPWTSPEAEVPIAVAAPRIAPPS